LHGDNSATLKATTVLAMLHWLGIKPSYSRPRVSNDNAFAESAFRTAKYRHEYVRRGFKDLDQARSRASEFVHWYNVEHRKQWDGSTNPMLFIASLHRDDRGRQMVRLRDWPETLDISRTFSGLSKSM
jgi:transposase InsO family protein